MKNSVCLLSILLLAFSSTCLAAGSINVQWGEDARQDGDGDGGMYKKKGGPPPHAPAHGYRAKHQYRYFPCCNVYQDRSRGIYFYVKGEGWEVGASLPADLRVSLGHYVNLDLDTDKPYEYHAEHRKQYPQDNYKPGKDKNKKSRS